MIKGALVVGSSQIRMPGALIVGAPYDLATLAQLIKDLFKSNEVGFAYDPNDLTTMWQDAAGTTPVTGAGQPVGLILDKSGRNNHARQTVSASRPILQRNATTGAYYLAFDGVDDFLQTNNIDFTATDKVSLFAGVRGIGTSLNSMLLELGTQSYEQNGSFSLRYYGSNIGSVDLTSRGTSYNNIIALGHIVPKSLVFSGRLNIKAPSLTLHVNGIQQAQNTNSQGTGNYGNYPLYIGRRGGTTLPLNGHLYSLIGIGRLTTDAETIALEKSIAKNTGVTLSV